jgi:Zn-dependent protease with chaperone function
VTVHLAMLLPLLATAVLAFGARPITASLAPSTAARLLTCANLITAVATGFALSILAFDVVAQNPTIATAGHWSVAVVRREALSPVLGAPAGVLVVVLLLAACLRVVRSLHHLWHAGVQCRRLGHGIDGLVIVDDDRADAYALPGLTGRIVLSTALLRALPAEELRVVLAHESSHLRHGHHLLRLLSDVAAAANPLLRPAAEAVRLATERWADEDAAKEVGDRRLVARALARAALVVDNEPDHNLNASLAIASSDVVTRTRALLAPAPHSRRAVAAVLMAAIAASTASLAIVERGTEVNFQQAQSAERLHTQSHQPLRK